MKKFTKIKLHQDVLKVRLYQHIIHEKIKLNQLKVVPHMAFGYEALSVSLISNLNKNDKLLLTHRNISYNLAFLVNNFDKYLNELNTKQTGINKGKIGSMNIINYNRGLIYTSSILGNNLPVGVGVALDQSTKNKKESVTYIVTGDGAIEEGSFYESLLLAKSLNLKIIFVIENNNFAMASTINERRFNFNLKNLSKSLGLDYYKFNGNDVYKYYKKFLQLKKQCIFKSSPILVETNIKMFNNHYGQTPGWPEDDKNISINKGLIIKNHLTDPAFVSYKSLDSKSKNSINSLLTSKEKKYLKK